MGRQDWNFRLVDCRISLFSGRRLVVSLWLVLSNWLTGLFCRWMGSQCCLLSGRNPTGLGVARFQYFHSRLEKKHAPNQCTDQVSALFVLHLVVQQSRYCCGKLRNLPFTYSKANHHLCVLQGHDCCPMLYYYDDYSGEIRFIDKVDKSQKKETDGFRWVLPRWIDFELTGLFLLL